MSTIKTLRDALKLLIIEWEQERKSAGNVCHEVRNLLTATAATEGMEADPVGAVELPPLPERDGDWAGDDWFTKDSMYTYARAALAERGTVGDPVAWMLEFNDEKVVTANPLEAEAWLTQHDNAYEVTPLCRCHPAPVGDGGLPVQVSIDSRQFIDLLNAYAHAPFGQDDVPYRAILAYIAAQRSPQAAEQGVAGGWIGVDERLPEDDELVLLYWPPGPNDWPNEPNYTFDCIDPNDDERKSWLNHNENYEHFCCVAKPEGSTGPSEKAPYTHWMRLAAPIIATKEPA